MTIDFRPDKGSTEVGQSQTTSQAPPSNTISTDLQKLLAFTPPEILDDDALADEQLRLLDGASGIARHDPAPINPNAFDGFADALFEAPSAPLSATARQLQADARATLMMADKLAPLAPSIWSAFEGMRNQVYRPEVELNLDHQEERIALFGHVQTALIAVQQALTATPAPSPETATILTGLAQRLTELGQGLAQKQTTAGSANLAGINLFRDARQAQADLETMQTFGVVDGISLSQRLAGGDKRAASILDLAGYTVSASNQVSSPDGHVLTDQQLDELGHSLLQKAADDYQLHKSTYQTMRSQLEDQLDMTSRNSLNELEESMRRLERQQRPRTTREAVIDSITLMVAQGEDLGSLDLTTLEQSGQTGIDESQISPSQKAFIQGLARFGGIVRRDNGRIFITGLTKTDLETARAVHRLLTTPNNDAARYLRDAFVLMAKAWAKADAIAQVTGMSLDNVLPSRTLDVEKEPPKPSLQAESTNSEQTQPLGIRPGETLTKAATDTTTHPSGGTTTAPTADQTHEAQIARLRRRHDELEKQDEERTDAKRQTALDSQTARRLTAEIEVAEKRNSQTVETPHHA